MGMALRAEADDRDLLVLDQIEIGIPIIINAHFLSFDAWLIESISPFGPIPF
jgi:hypothetical protein